MSRQNPTKRISEIRDGILYLSCNICRQIKPETEFYRSKPYKFGRNYCCKSCDRNRNKDNWRNSFIKTRANLRKDVFERLGNKCKRCGFSDIRALQIDHINGNHGKKRMQWYALRKYLLSLSDEELYKEYQLLCANCNQIKKVENNEQTIKI